jgi:hypothetical protein
MTILKFIRNIPTTRFKTGLAESIQESKLRKVWHKAFKNEDRLGKRHSRLETSSAEDIQG